MQVGSSFRFKTWPQRLQTLSDKAITTVQNIVTLLTKDFVKWLGLALIIAIPCAHYAMSQWLQTFEYKVAVGAGIYIVAAMITLTLVLIATSWQSIRVALMNPVNSLRNE